MCRSPWQYSKISVRISLMPIASVTLPNCVSELDNNQQQQVPGQTHRDVFQGTGCVQREYKMVFLENAIPNIQMLRRVPLALQKSFKEKLKRMLKAEIISKVEEPTDWLSPLVIIKKKRQNMDLYGSQKN